MQDETCPLYTTYAGWYGQQDEEATCMLWRDTTDRNEALQALLDAQQYPFDFYGINMHNNAEDTEPCQSTHHSSM